MAYPLICSLFILSLNLASCGSFNVFSAAEDPDPEVQAAILMEQKKPKKARSLLEKALKKDPDNDRYLSLLSLAVAQIYQVDPISIGLKWADTGTGSSISASQASNGIEAMFGFIPEATTDNISGVKLAIYYLEAIPQDKRRAADHFKLSILQTAALALSTKKLDQNANGKIDLEEAIAMGDEDASTILNSLDGGISSLEAGTISGLKAASAGTKIRSIKESIEGQSGDTQEDKLRNYLKPSSSPSPSPSPTDLPADL